MSAVLKRYISLGIVLLSTGWLASCATSRQKDSTEDQKIEALTAQNKQLEASLAALNSKLDSMDTKLGSMNDKVDQTKTRMDNLAGNIGTPRPNSKSVEAAPVGKPSMQVGDDDEKDDSGYVADESIQKYRSAMILFEAHNYPEAVLAFSSFVDQFPDHPLAGDAQYFLGEAYFKQKEYKLAIRELNRVLMTYDRSSHISDALRDLVTSEESIGDKDSAARHRQQLLSMFPNSPAASGVAETNSAAPQTSSETVPQAEAAPPQPTEPAPPTPTSATTETKGIAAPAANPQLDAPPPTAPEAQAPIKTTPE